jgi:hypothetical protein
MTSSPEATVPERGLVEELARQVLEDVAPEELAIFDDTAEEYHRDPQGVLAASGRDEAVGFGLDLALLTPYALAMAGAVLTYLVNTVAKAAKKESEPLISDWIHRLFRRKRGRKEPAGHDTEEPAADAPEVHLSADEVEQVREVALARARDLKLPADTARLLADAIVGGLNVAT